jgi:hypothetical protein
MRILRFVSALGLVVGLAAAAAAQGAAKDGQLALIYDVDVTALTYCVPTGGPFADPISVTQRIKTTGSSTTVTEFVTGGAPFTNVVVGDALAIRTPNSTTTTLVSVVAKASAASITVDTAITLSDTAGHPFSYYHHVCGTTDNDGWFAVPAGAQWLSIAVQYDQGDLGAFVVRWEKKEAGPLALPMVVYPGGASDCGALGFSLSTDRCSATTAGVLARLEVVDEAPSGFYRVGLAYVTSDALDTTTNLEKVTVKVAVR